MAKASKMPTKVEPYKYPDRFGSHQSMVVKDLLEGETLEEGMCICQDEFGRYKTEIRRIDNGLSDPNRYRESRIGKLFQGKKEDDK